MPSLNHIVTNKAGRWTCRECGEEMQNNSIGEAARPCLARQIGVEVILTDRIGGALDPDVQ